MEIVWVEKFKGYDANGTMVLENILMCVINGEWVPVPTVRGPGALETLLRGSSHQRQTEPKPISTETK
jgi:hypothetical protein